MKLKAFVAPLGALALALLSPFASLVCITKMKKISLPPMIEAVAVMLTSLLMSSFGLLMNFAGEIMTNLMFPIWLFGCSPMGLFENLYGLVFGSPWEKLVDDGPPPPQKKKKNAGCPQKKKKKKHGGRGGKKKKNSGGRGGKRKSNASGGGGSPMTLLVDFVDGLWKKVANLVGSAWKKFIASPPRKNVTYFNSSRRCAGRRCGGRCGGRRGRMKLIGWLLLLNLGLARAAPLFNRGAVFQHNPGPRPGISNYLRDEPDAVQHVQWEAEAGGCFSEEKMIALIEALVEIEKDQNYDYGSSDASKYMSRSRLVHGYGLLPDHTLPPPRFQLVDRSSSDRYLYWYEYFHITDKGLGDAGGSVPDMTYVYGMFEAAKVKFGKACVRAQFIVLSSQANTNNTNSHKPGLPASADVSEKFQTPSRPHVGSGVAASAGGFTTPLVAPSGQDALSTIYKQRKELDNTYDGQVDSSLAAEAEESRARRKAYGDMLKDQRADFFKFANNQREAWEAFDAKDVEERKANVEKTMSERKKRKDELDSELKEDAASIRKDLSARKELFKGSTPGGTRFDPMGSNMTSPPHPFPRLDHSIPETPLRPGVGSGVFIPKTTSLKPGPGTLTFGNSTVQLPPAGAASSSSATNPSSSKSKPKTVRFGNATVSLPPADATPPAAPEASGVSNSSGSVPATSPESSKSESTDKSPAPIPEDADPKVVDDDAESEESEDHHDWLVNDFGHLEDEVDGVEGEPWECPKCGHMCPHDAGYCPNIVDGEKCGSTPASQGGPIGWGGTGASSQLDGLASGDLRRCPDCYLVFPSGKVCPVCSLPCLPVILEAEADGGGDQVEDPTVALSDDASSDDGAGEENVEPEDPPSGDDGDAEKPDDGDESEEDPPAVGNWVAVQHFSDLNPNDTVRVRFGGQLLLGTVIGRPRRSGVDIMPVGGSPVKSPIKITDPSDMEKFQD